MIPPTVTNFRSIITLTLCVVILSGCSSLINKPLSSISKNSRAPNVAKAFNSDAKQTHDDLSASKITPVPRDGLAQNDNKVLNLAIGGALMSNHRLIEQRALLSQAIQRSIISDAEQGFNLNAKASSSLATNSTTSNSAQNFNLALNGSWQMDVWGALNNTSKAAHYQVAQSKAQLKHTQQQLIGDITRRWYQLIFWQQTHQLVLEQQQNTADQSAAVESSYRQGLNGVGDVYLARANLDSARSRRSQAGQSLSSAARDLQLLLGQYPNGQLRIEGVLPRLSAPPTLGVPADLLKNRADINNSWLAILAQDASVASSYAAQFPRFSLSGSLSLSQARLTDLFSQNIAWSLLSNISKTLLDGGRQKATYQLSKALLIEREQEYLQVLQQAFSEVESIIEAEQSLAEQWQLNAQVLKNTTLSYQQITIEYQHGIANYQQVLNLQQQLFDDQKNQLSLDMQKIENRIALLLALGSPSDNQSKTTTANPKTIK